MLKHFVVRLKPYSYPGQYDFFEISIFADSFVFDYDVLHSLVLKVGDQSIFYEDISHLDSVFIYHSSPDPSDWFDEGRSYEYVYKAG